MFGVLIFLIVLLVVFLVIVILMQASKGGGLAGTFGGGGQMTSMFGTRRTADFLSKATWWIGGTIVFLIFVVNLFVLPSLSNATNDSIIQRGGIPDVTNTPRQVPQNPTPEQQQPPQQQPPQQ